MRAGVMKEALAPSLAEAELTFVYTDGLDWDAPPVFASLGARAQCHGELGALVDAITGTVRPGDQILVMSNGSFGGLCGRLLARLGEAGGDTDQGQAPGPR